MPRSRKGAWRPLAVLAAAAMVLAACGSDDDGGSGQTGDGEQKTVNIAFVGAKTGDSANLGLAARDGAKLAVEEENAKNDGVRIVLKEFDTTGAAAQATTIAPQFLADESIVASVGPCFSGETKALIPLYQDAKLGFISPVATNSQLPDVVPNQTVFHRDIGDDAFQGRGMAAYLASVKPKSVAYVHDNTEYGKGLEADTRRQAEAQGVKTAILETVDPKAQDYSATVNKVKASGADWVFYGGYYAEAGRFRKQLVDAGVKADFVAGDGSLDPGIITAGGAATNGVKLTCPCGLAFESSTGKVKEFYDKYNEAIGRPPTLYSIEAYDATKIIIRGIKEGNDTRAKMHDWLENGFDKHEGVFRDIEFEDNGNLKATTFFIFEVKDGKIQPGTELELEAPAAGATTTSAARATTTSAG